MACLLWRDGGRLPTDLLPLQPRGTLQVGRDEERAPPTRDAARPGVGGGGNLGRPEPPAGPPPRAHRADAGRLRGIADPDRRARSANCGAVPKLGSTTRRFPSDPVAGAEAAEGVPATSATAQLRFSGLLRRTTLAPARLSSNAIRRATRRDPKRLSKASDRRQIDEQSTKMVIRSYRKRQPSAWRHPLFNVVVLVVLRHGGSTDRDAGRHAAGHFLPSARKTVGNCAASVCGRKLACT